METKIPAWAPKENDVVECSIASDTVEHVVRFKVVKYACSYDDRKVAFKVKMVEPARSGLMLLTVNKNATQRENDEYDTTNFENFSEHKRGFWFDVSDLKIIEKGEPLVPTIDVKGFTKGDLICYVIFVNGGEMQRSAILQKVAELEGKQYVQGTNVSYFVQIPQPFGGKSLVDKKLIAPTGKRGCYAVTVQGKAVAKRVIEWSVKRQAQSDGDF